MIDNYKKRIEVIDNPTELLNAKYLYIDYQSLVVYVRLCSD
jgi:hypothetical protein